MIKNSNGITLVSLVITIAVMIIIASITVSTSMDRFEINNLNKMINDIEFLKEKVSNYYLKYNELPVVKDADNKSIEYTNINFSVDTDDNEKYYIIDLEAMGDIALNYGKEGFENLNSSNDVYIINEETHNIYYVKGIEWNGEYYHTKLSNKNLNEAEDNIPPTTPQIKVISGTKNEKGIYTSEVEIEIIPGKDNSSGINKTTYTINGSKEIDITTLENNILALTEEGDYTILVKTYDNNNNISELTYTLEIETKVTVATLKGKNILSVMENVTIKDDVGKEIVIPAGFAIASDSADTIKEGVVITDALTDGNQFVWIPVDNINKMVMCKNKTENDQCDIQFNSGETALICKTHNDSTDICGKLYATTTGENFDCELKTQTYTSSSFKEPANLSGRDTTTNLPMWTPTLYQDSFEKMAISVAKNKGFYVGRYETSFDENISKAQSKLGKVPMQSMNWFRMYENSLTYTKKRSNIRNDMGMSMGCNDVVDVRK